MSDLSYADEILDEVSRLSPEKQKRVLDFARGLTRPKGISGKEAIRIAREINISSEDLAEMEQAIEEWCERIDDWPDVNFDE
jgi:hypothetical protein